MADGAYVDIVHPLNNETLQMILDRVVAEYEKIAGEPIKRRCNSTVPHAYKAVARRCYGNCG
jgi:DNA-binding cell septation regulator SpoVG